MKTQVRAKEEIHRAIPWGMFDELNSRGYYSKEDLKNLGMDENTVEKNSLPMTNLSTYLYED